MTKHEKETNKKITFYKKLLKTAEQQNDTEIVGYYKKQLKLLDITKTINKYFI